MHPSTTFTLAFIGSACCAMGQEVLAPGPVYQVTPPVMRDFESSRAGFIPSVETSATGKPQLDNQLQWSIFDLRPHALYRFTYGDGIQSSPGNKHTTAINEISPGFLVDIGSHWSLDYTPSLRFYSSKAFRDTTDHAVTLSGGAVSGDWVFSGGQSYRSSSTPLVETGAQTDQEFYGTTFSASRRFGSKVSNETSLEQNFGNSQQFASYKQWGINDWLNYQVRPRLTLGAGIGGGYVHMDLGPDSIYEQYQGRVNWRVTDKLSVMVNGGLEDRQFQSGGAGDLLNPIYGASVVYKPFEFTQLSITGSRMVSPSYFQGQVNENTSIRADFNQRLLGHFFLNMGGGYRNANYVASAANTVAGRNDDYYFYDARLSCAIRKRGSVGVFYRHSENTSNTSQFAFTSDQVGVELGYHF